MRKTLWFIIFSVILLTGYIENNTLQIENQSNEYDFSNDELTQKEMKEIQKRDKENYEKYLYSLKFIKNKALLKELVLYNNDGNFDRHDALVMLMLLREDFLRYCGTESPSERNHYKDNNYLGNDTFFEKNYKPKKNKDNDSWI